MGAGLSVAADVSGFGAEAVRALGAVAGEGSLFPPGMKGLQQPAVDASRRLDAGAIRQKKLGAG